MELENSVSKITGRIISEKLINENVISVKCVPLDTDGHFTSTVKSLEIFTENTFDSNSKKTIKIIAKILENRGDDYLKLAFTKENEFYSSLMPLYNNIGLSNRIDAVITPNYYGSNISSSGDEIGIILLENLQSFGYEVNPERYIDWDHTKLIIDKMSYFHALGIALKRRHRKAFEEDFKHLIEPALINSHLVDRSSVNSKLRTEIKNILQKQPEMNSFTSKVDKLLEKIDNMRIPQPKEPFSTLIHNDLWKNNILFKYSTTDRTIPVDAKFIDFQFVLYNSPIRDLVYFIFSSCSLSIQKEFRKISMLYYENFVRNLGKLNCDTSEFTESRFIEELIEYAPTKFKHLILLLKKTPSTFQERLMDLVLCHAESGLL